MNSRRPPAAGNHKEHGVFVTDFSGPLADCVLRMVRLLETPAAIPILASAIMREISYWVLTGPHGGEVVTMTMANKHERSVIRTVHALRDRFAEAIRIEELAGIAKMSPTAFHRHLDHHFHDAVAISETAEVDRSPPIDAVRRHEC